MQKKFLFVSPDTTPFEPSSGGIQRSNLLLRACLKIGDVDVVTFVEGVVSNLDKCEVVYSRRIPASSNISRTRKWFGLLRPWDPYSFFPIDKEREAVIDGIVSQKAYDAIIVRYIPDVMSCGLMKYADRLVIDVDDHPKDKLKMTAKQAKTKPNKIYYYLASALADVTVNSITRKKVRATFFPNPEQVVGPRGFFLPNVPFDEPHSDLVRFDATKPRLFFVGLLDYYPNYSGLDRFVENVWPIVKRTVPNAEFHIAGKITGDVAESYRNKWNREKGVSVLGFVGDITSEYEACRATVSPIYVGAGTNIKLVESMQRKRVCVTTEIGMRGLKSFFESGKDVLVAKDANDFAQLCIRALTDEGFNHHVASNAYSKVMERFSHETFDEIVKKALE